MTRWLNTNDYFFDLAYQHAFARDPDQEWDCPDYELAPADRRFAAVMIIAQQPFFEASKGLK